MDIEAGCCMLCFGAKEHIFEKLLVFWVRLGFVVSVRV